MCTGRSIVVAALMLGMAMLLLWLLNAGSAGDAGVSAPDSRDLKAEGTLLPSRQMAVGQALVRKEIPKFPRPPRPGGSHPESTIVTIQLVMKDNSIPVPNMGINAHSTRGDAASAAITDGTGLARLELPGGTLRTVWIAGDERAPAQLFAMDKELNGGHEMRLRLAVEPGQFVTGRVVDERGRGVRDARVIGGGMHEAHAVTRANGSFRIGPFRERATLRAEFPGKITKYGVGTDFTFDEPKDLIIVLVPAVPLRGRVIGPVGGVVGAAVRWGGTPSGDVLTSADGRFELDVPEGSQEIRVTAPGLLPWSGHHDPGEGDLVVRLHPGASLVGTVRERGGAFVAGVRVKLSATGPDELPEQITSADGRFAFVGLRSPQDAVLEVVANGYFLQELELSLGPGQNVQQFVLERCQPITGTVLDGDGVPARNVSVLLGDSGDPLLVHGRDGVQTDDRGRFRFLHFPRLPRYFIWSNGARWFDRPWIRSAKVEGRPGDDMVLKLDPKAFRAVAFLGTVRDALTGAPIQQFQVTFSTPSPSTRHRYFNGLFEYAGIAPEDLVRLVFRAPDHVTREIPARRYQPGDNHLDVLLWPARKVTFRLVTDHGRPAPGAVLMVLDREGRTLTQQTGRNSRGPWLEASAAGFVIARQVPGGPCFVASAPYLDGRWRRVAFDFTATPSEPVDVVVQSVQWVGQRIAVFGTAAPQAAPDRLDLLLSEGAAWPLESGQVRFERSFMQAGARPIWRNLPKLSPAGADGSLSLRLPALPVRLRVFANGYRNKDRFIQVPGARGVIRILLKVSDPP